jgi:hypothetical protein
MKYRLTFDVHLPGVYRVDVVGPLNPASAIDGCQYLHAGQPDRLPQIAVTFTTPAVAAPAAPVTPQATPGCWPHACSPLRNGRCAWCGLATGCICGATTDVHRLGCPAWGERLDR